ncbi:hypothetical protein OAB57_03115, partial [Bacteriovoracaceae bacterium]|nr:hypothetical protein [Bacteriovoracaceae bacterium]
YISEVEPFKEKMSLYDKKRKGLTNKNLTMLLGITNDGDIVDGEWTNKSIEDHPDFTWMQTRIEPNQSRLFGSSMMEIMQGAGVRQKPTNRRTSNTVNRRTASTRRSFLNNRNLRNSRHLSEFNGAARRRAATSRRRAENREKELNERRTNSSGFLGGIRSFFGL